MNQRRMLPEAFTIILHGQRNLLLTRHGSGPRLGPLVEDLMIGGNIRPDTLAPWGLTLEVYEALGPIGIDGIARWRQLVSLQRRREAERTSRAGGG